MIEYKNQFKIYQEARALREQELREIGATFIQALKQASKELKNAGRSATSRANFAAATALAAANRDKAVAELEPLMNPPQPPTKPSGLGMKGNKWKAPSPKADRKN
jgi:aminopeptidase N